MSLLPRLPEPFKARVREPIIAKVLPGPLRMPPMGTSAVPCLSTCPDGQVPSHHSSQSRVCLQCGVLLSGALQYGDAQDCKHA